MQRKTQQQRVLEVLKSLSSEHDIPEEYIRRHPTGDGVSARYFKQVMLISEVNGRISELRNKGHVIETSTERDRYGFVYHRLAQEFRNLTRADHLNIAKDAVRAFEAA
jgi:hypothetical protein